MAWYLPLSHSSLAKLTTVAILSSAYDLFPSFSLFSVHIPEAFKYVQHLFELVMGFVLKMKYSYKDLLHHIFQVDR